MAGGLQALTGLGQKGNGAWVGALTDRDARRRFPPSWEREHGVTATQLHAITDAIGAVLGGEPLTRAELVTGICRHLGDASLDAPLSTGWGALLKPAAARGLLCSGPARDGGVTFVGPAAWLGRPLSPVELDGEAGFVVRAEDVDELTSTPDGGTDPADAPLLLPGFDPWVIAPLSHRRRAIPDGRESEVSRTAGWISPVLVVDGVVAGVWE